MNDFVAVLRGLATNCSFGEQLHLLLRDRLVCGINDTAVQTRLLELPVLSFHDAVKAALASRDAAEISPSSGPPFKLPVAVLLTNEMVAMRGDSCHCCSDVHQPQHCLFQQASCHFCGKPGHIARVCRAKKRQSSGPTHLEEPGFSRVGSTCGKSVLQPFSSTLCRY